MLARPRSPYPYHTRLKRPGVRPSSPALTSDGIIDYSRMVEVERRPSYVSEFAWSCVSDKANIEHSGPSTGTTIGPIPRTHRGTITHGIGLTTLTLLGPCLETVTHLCRRDMEVLLLDLIRHGLITAAASQRATPQIKVVVSLVSHPLFRCTGLLPNLLYVSLPSRARGPFITTIVRIFRTIQCLSHVSRYLQCRGRFPVRTDQ